MTDVTPWTLTLGGKGLRDTNEERHRLLSVLKVC